ncbi:unnamed protein product [Sphacelaria rigidula]
MPDRGEDEKMRFALTERQASGKMFVRGEAVLDLNKYRHVGKSFELWEPLVEPKSILWGGFGAKSSLELHLTITYCVSDNGLLTVSGWSCAVLLLRWFYTRMAVCRRFCFCCRRCCCRGVHFNTTSRHVGGARRTHLFLVLVV